jgi:hypothetical protein
MPKVRAIEASFIDIQKHLSVGRSRITKVPNSPETIKQRNNLMEKIDECMRLTQEIIKEVITFVENENLSQSLEDRTITNELALIDKEAKKNMPITDRRAAVRAMCNCTDLKEAYKIGKQYNIEPQYIDQIIKKAPISTSLGKAYATLLKSKQTPVVAVIQPQVMEDEDDNTIDSDLSNDPELQKLLAAKEG